MSIDAPHKSPHSVDNKSVVAGSKVYFELNLQIKDTCREVVLSLKALADRKMREVLLREVISIVSYVKGSFIGGSTLMHYSHFENLHVFIPPANTTKLGISLGIAIPVFGVIIFISLCLLIKAKAARTHRSNPRPDVRVSRGMASTGPRPRQYHYTTAQPTATTGTRGRSVTAPVPLSTYPVASPQERGNPAADAKLTTADPPSYTSVLADNGENFGVFLPPPYPGISKDTSK